MNPVRKQLATEIRLACLLSTLLASQALIAWPLSFLDTCPLPFVPLLMSWPSEGWMVGRTGSVGSVGSVGLDLLESLDGRVSAVSVAPYDEAEGSVMIDVFSICVLASLAAYILCLWSVLLEGGSWQYGRERQSRQSGDPLSAGNIPQGPLPPARAGTAHRP